MHSAKTRLLFIAGDYLNFVSAELLETMVCLFLTDYLYNKA